MITYLRLSITDRCDLQCPYCMPHRRACERPGNVLSADELFTLVSAFAQNGVAKVRLTGGEPLLRDDLVEIVDGIARIQGITTVALTTNGIRLAEMARSLANAGLQRVNISIDSLHRETFSRITGSDALDGVLRGLHAALECGLDKIKVNTVVMRGINDSEIPAIAEMACRLPVEARFIELMPLGHNTREWQTMYVPAAEIRDKLGHLEPLPYEAGSSARRYHLAQGQGVVGIISPVSDNFCQGCNRIRVTCSGKLRPCLRLPVEDDVTPLLGMPDFAGRLHALVGRLSRHKLCGSSASSSAIQAEAMCAIGG